VATPEEMEAAMVANLKEKTGRTLPEWLAVAAGSGLGKHGAIVKMLKTDHGVTHGYANLIAHHALRAGAPAPAAEDLTAAQYAGRKAGLRPVLDAILAAAGEFGPGLEVAPKKTCVSLRRRKQFALVQPSTATRVDLGLNLKGEKAGGRLEASGGFSAMCTHRVRLEGPKDVDAEVKGWLRKAWEGAG